MHEQLVMERVPSRGKSREVIRNRLREQNRSLIRPQRPLTARGLGGTESPVPEGQLCDFPVQTDVQILFFSLIIFTRLSLNCL